MMKIKVCLFSENREVLAIPHNMEESEDYDKILWVEKSEDWYSLLSPRFKDKKVAIVTRENWLDGDKYE